MLSCLLMKEKTKPEYMKIKVIIIDDHTLFREGLQRLLVRHEIDVIASVSNGDDGLKSIKDLEPDIILLDLRMPEMSGIDVLKSIREIKKSLPVVMLTTSDNEKDLIEALRNGASGYLLKDMEPDDLVVALKDVLKGETIVAPNLVQILAKFHQGDDSEINISNLIGTLTPRENEILELLAEGQSNKLIAKNLKKKFKRIIIAKNNQEIVNECSWVFLSVTPTVGKKIIKQLEFKKDQTIISFVSTITLKQIKKAIKVNAKIIRAIPLPPISLRKGPVPICPPNPKVKAFFNNLGTTVEIKNEQSSINFWSTSGMMAPFYEMLRVMTDWLVKRGVKRNNAQKYITSLFLALSKDAVVNSKENLKNLVKESQTPKGLNEQGLKEMSKRGVYKSVINTLNSIHKRLNK